jgi:shikimate dehydrogenase
MEGRIYGLIGRTLKHSHSVPIHKALGTGSYRLIELEPEALASFLQRGDLGGLNVTIPYKRDVMTYCSSLDETARAIGSVNTLVRQDGGTLKGFNTDAYGLRYTAKRAGISFAGHKVVVFGSGGASLTAQYVAKQSGASSVVVVSRSGPDNYENLSRHADADILVNATPVGMYPHTGTMPADPAAFPDCKGVLEVVYNPRRTAFILRAEALGVPCSDGLPMLVAQAKAAEELFFNRKIPDSEIERILKKLYRDIQNIVLIGMPGSGKSTVGSILSRITDRTAVDLDAKIEKAAGCTIPEIFAASGEETFRRMEREQAQKWGMQSGNILITGGGIVKDEHNYASLKQNGRIYQVERDIRLLARAGRPLSENADLAEMYRQRQPLYEHFRDAAAQNDGPAEATAHAIWEDYCEHSDH